MASHPALTTVLAGLDRSRATLRAAVERVRADKRDHPPAADCWSVAGVLEHLALVDERYIGMLRGSVADARAAAVPSEQGDPQLLPSKIEAMLADRTERRQAPPPLVPTGLGCADAWARAEASRAALIEALTAAAGLAPNRVVQEHPRFGALTVYQVGGFVAAHELRHAEQLREIASQFDRDQADTALQA